MLDTLQGHDSRTRQLALARAMEAAILENRPEDDLAAQVLDEATSRVSANESVETDTGRAVVLRTLRTYLEENALHGKNIPRIRRALEQRLLLPRTPVDRVVDSSSTIFPRKEFFAEILETFSNPDRKNVVTINDYFTVVVRGRDFASRGGFSVITVDTPESTTQISLPGSVTRDTPHGRTVTWFVCPRSIGSLRETDDPAALLHKLIDVVGLRLNLPGIHGKFTLEAVTFPNIRTPRELRNLFSQATQELKIDDVWLEVLWRPVPRTNEIVVGLLFAIDEAPYRAILRGLVGAADR